MTDNEAYELGRKAIYHATHRDAMSGGMVRSKWWNYGNLKRIWIGFNIYTFSI